GQLSPKVGKIPICGKTPLWTRPKNQHHVSVQPGSTDLTSDEDPLRDMLELSGMDPHLS
ncbi:hypothetical protein CRENBAI_018840, partial [Crenichthys baileyi]